jgi:hypothetical protein
LRPAVAGINIIDNRDPVYDGGSGVVMNVMAIHI